VCATWLHHNALPAGAEVETLPADAEIETHTGERPVKGNTGRSTGGCVRLITVPLAAAAAGAAPAFLRFAVRATIPCANQRFPAMELGRLGPDLVALRRALTRARVGESRAGRVRDRTLRYSEDRSFVLDRAKRVEVNESFYFFR
jgi:hypothetical protein